MNPLGQELSKLAVMKPVQGYKQRFLDRTKGSGIDISQSLNVYDTERKLAENWLQVEAYRTMREKMERK